MNILNWIWNNLAYIKDILWIVFTLIATVIAILTYRRARFTILQPLRTEVIKKQTDIFVKVLDTFKDEKKLVSDLDLIDIVAINTFIVMDEYGYITSISEKTKVELKNMKLSAIFVKRGENLNSVVLPTVFSSDKEKFLPNFELGKRNYENLKNGEVDIEMIHLTEKYVQTIENFSDISNNPFLPKEIKIIIDNMIKNINYDISVSLKEVLENVLLELYKRSQKKEECKVDPTGVYNNLNRKRISNSENITLLREKMREYLLIDKKW